MAISVKKKHMLTVTYDSPNKLLKFSWEITGSINKATLTSSWCLCCYCIGLSFSGKKKVNCCLFSLKICQISASPILSGKMCPENFHKFGCFLLNYHFSAKFDLKIREFPTKSAIFTTGLSLKTP